MITSEVMTVSKGVNANEVFGALEQKLETYTASQIISAFDKDPRTKPLRSRLLEVIGLVKTEEPTNPLILKEQGALFRGALLGFAGVQLGGNASVMGVQNPIGADFLDVQRHTPPHKRFHTKAFRDTSLQGFHLLRRHYNHINEWNLEVTRSRSLSGHFSAGMGLALYLSQEADVLRVNELFRANQSHDNEEWQAVEEKYGRLYD